MYELTKHEELILLSIAKLTGNAYIVTIRNNIKEITGKAINYGSLCNTLSSLVKKGYLDSKESEPSSEQGGRRKVLFFLSDEGKNAPRYAYEVQKTAWDGVSAFIYGAD